MCHICGQPSYYPCNCVQTSCNPCTSYTGCPIQLDASCVFYHIANNSTSQLTGLNLSNGATLQLILETIDVKIRELNVPTWTLTCLRASYVINTLQQFGQAVDTEICDLQDQIDTLSSSAAVPLVATDSTSIDFSQSGTLDHTFTGVVKISATAGNQATILGDGLYTTPQTLSVNYIDKQLTISDGNTVDLASLVCGASGFLGNLASDPVAVDGQYWWNTTSSLLKIQVNGVVKTITTT